MRRKILSIILIGALAFSGFTRAAEPPVAAPATRPAAAENFPIAVVELRGDGAAIGEEHGHALGDRIRMLHEKYLLNFIHDGKVRVLAMLAAAGFEARMLPEHRAEMLALAKSTGIGEHETMLGQCFLDLLPSIACSTIALPASASPDGVARFGRNLDFPSLSVADNQSVLFVYHPEGRYQFAAVGWPGMIGVLSGMNEHGLCLANMEVQREPRATTAMPYVLLYRMVLERCRTVDEAIDLLRKTPRQSANNLMLMDAAGNRAVAEITPEQVIVRHGDADAPLISTNHQRGEDTSTTGRCWRYDCLHEEATAQFGTIDVSSLEHLLGKVVQGTHGSMTLQSMVFEPSNRVIYVATGADAPRHPYSRIDLKPYFRQPINHPK